MWKRRGTLPKLPKFFLDRNLGNRKLPQALREYGIDCITLGEYFGEKNGQKVQDPEWLLLVANENWVAFTKDKRIRNWPSERDTIIKHKIKCFCYLGAQYAAPTPSALCFEIAQLLSEKLPTDLPTEFCGISSYFDSVGNWIRHLRQQNWDHGRMLTKR